VAIKVNLIIDQGTDYTTNINVTDDNDQLVDLTGYSGAAQMRKHYTSTTVYAFNVGIQTGAVTLSMNSSTTSAITAGRYVYDCELVDPQGKTSRLVEGIVTITPQVTR
jgi:hypothetical protein